MTLIPRVVAVFALLASALPLAAATGKPGGSTSNGSDSCGSNEFWYENKSCCVKQGPPQNPPKPPSGTSCPSSNSHNWYWSSDKSCCLPSNPPPPGNPAPSCPKSHNWNPQGSVCTPHNPGGQGPSDCQSNEFWFGDKGCCLPHGGPPNSPSPPKGSQCPSSGWYWGKDQGCCVPHNPPPSNNPPPQCPHGWDWISHIFQCQPSPSPPSHYPPQPSGHHYKRTSKVRTRSLCPTGLDACPIIGQASDYECIDIENDLGSCGGCLETGAGQDCTAITGAWNVGCEQGSCAVYTCVSGYKLASDKKSCLPL